MMTSGKNVFCQKGKGYQIVLSFLRQTHGTAAVSRVFLGYVQDWARLGGVIIFTQVYFSSKLLCTTHTAAQYCTQWGLSLHS